MPLSLGQDGTFKVAPSHFNFWSSHESDASTARADSYSRGLEVRRLLELRRLEEERKRKEAEAARQRQAAVDAIDKRSPAPAANVFGDQQGFLDYQEPLPLPSVGERNTTNMYNALEQTRAANSRTAEALGTYTPTQTDAHVQRTLEAKKQSQLNTYPTERQQIERDNQENQRLLRTDIPTWPESVSDIFHRTLVFNKSLRDGSYVEAISDTLKDEEAELKGPAIGTPERFNYLVAGQLRDYQNFVNNDVEAGSPILGSLEVQARVLFQKELEALSPEERIEVINKYAPGGEYYVTGGVERGFAKKDFVTGVVAEHAYKNYKSTGVLPRIGSPLRHAEQPSVLSGLQGQLCR